METPAQSATATCPNCSYPVPTGAIECPACGVIYAKYRPPAEPPPHAAPATEPDGDLFNPYAPPEAEVELPLCLEHDRARKTWLGVGVLGLLSAGALFVNGLSGPNLEGYWLAGLAVGLGALFVLVLANQPVRPKKIDDQHIWLTHASPDFLATLPDAPFYLRS